MNRYDMDLPEDAPVFTGLYAAIRAETDGSL